MDKVALLAKYLPVEAAPVIARWIDYFVCEFKISRSRSSKFGDYRAPFKAEGHRISVNCNLNPYAFLITTVHEFAHLLTWNQHKGEVKPHGLEWKQNFKQMMQPFITMCIFPDDIKKAVKNYLENPAASSCADLNLYRVLKRYDSVNATLIAVENLPLNSRFAMKNGRIFIKEAQVKKRFRCKEVNTGKLYLFNPLAEVRLLNN